MSRDSAGFTTSRRGSAWLVILAALVPTLIILVWGSLRSPQNAFDDAFITYRYADNLRRGVGLVYNPGEWVLGTTAPFYALSLAGLSRVGGGAMEWWGHWLSVLGWIACAWAVLGQLWQTGRRVAGTLAALFIAVMPAMVPALGMETGFCLALLWLSAWAWMRDRLGLAAVLSALAILTRQDSVLLVGLLVIARSLALRRILWRPALLIAALLAPWFGYAFWRYGTLLPNSALAKINQNAVMRVEGVRGFSEQFFSSLTWSSPVVALALVAAMLAGIYVIAKWARAWWWAPVWVVAYVAAYTFLNVNPFPWYFVAPITGALVVCALGLGAFLGDGSMMPLGTLRGAGAVLAVSCAGVIVGLHGQSAFAQSVSDQPGYRAEYRDVGAWLAANTQLADRVAAIEIGVIGYRSGRPVLDTMGLVSPQMRGHLVGWVQTLVYAVEQQRPEYAVGLAQSGWGAVVDQWWFLQQYRPVAQFGSATIYARRPDVPAGYRVDMNTAFASGFAVTGLEASDRLLAPRTPLTMTLDVAVERQIGEDCNLVTFLSDTATYERLSVQAEMPYGGGYGCLAWRPGDRLRIPVKLTPPGDIHPGAYQLGVEFMKPKTGEYFYLASEATARTVQLGWFRAGRPEPRSIRGKTVPADAKWDGGIQLRNVTVPEPPLAGNVPQTVGLEWQAESVPNRDLTVFVHLLDAAGNIVAQSDRRPFDGRFPTSVWNPGEQLQDVFVLQPPAALPEGEYSVRVGLYDAAGRLLLAGGGADSVTLDRVYAVAGK